MEVFRLKRFGRILRLQQGFQPRKNLCRVSMRYVITASAYSDHKTSDRIGPALLHRTGGKNPAPISSSFSPSPILSLNSWILPSLPSFVPRGRSIFGLTCSIGEKAMETKGVGSLGHG